MIKDTCTMIFGGFIDLLVETREMVLAFAGKIWKKFSERGKALEDEFYGIKDEIMNDINDRIDEVKLWTSTRWNS
jgi:hypothetical protein